MAKIQTGLGRGLGALISDVNSIQQAAAKRPAEPARPLVSTSANISGEPTPKKFAEISEAIRSAVDHIVEPALERGATGQSSSIIKVGLDYSIEIIRK